MDTTYMVLLKDFLKLFKCLDSSGILTIFEWLNLFSTALHQERKRINERILARLVWARVCPFPTVPGAVAGNGAETRHWQ